MRSDISDLSVSFKCLSDPTRLRILNLLCEGEVCVCHLVAVLGLVQPLISRHLAYLKKAGLVEARREGKWMHYKWQMQANPATRNVNESLRDWMMKNNAMITERQKLKKVRCL